ncbi:Protein RALF-like 1 [Camellia lanceoleosa]|uniref:Protein RALF-like 1 n=1 Tax=Camellia lanceoleosa TaxID=1840588 RepID=A0ACC0GF50_9ERIC|nr:Protein RALF-like 1 [Camellia lanceoleosa]
MKGMQQQSLFSLCLSFSFPFSFEFPFRLMKINFWPWLTLLLLALAMVVESSSEVFDGTSLETIVTHSQHDLLHSHGIATCHGQVGDCIAEAEEMIMDSEISRRTLAQTQRFISYKVINKDHTPCYHRGHSYYDCNKMGEKASY